MILFITIYTVLYLNHHKSIYSWVKFSPGTSCRYSTCMWVLYFNTICHGRVTTCTYNTEGTLITIQKGNSTYNTVVCVRYNHHVYIFLGKFYVKHRQSV